MVGGDGAAGAGGARGGGVPGAADGCGGQADGGRAVAGAAAGTAVALGGGCAGVGPVGLGRSGGEGAGLGRGAAAESAGRVRALEGGAVGGPLRGPGGDARSFGVRLPGDGGLGRPVAELELGCRQRAFAARKVRRTEWVRPAGGPVRGRLCVAPGPDVGGPADVGPAVCGCLARGGVGAAVRAAVRLAAGGGEPGVPAAGGWGVRELGGGLEGGAADRGVGGVGGPAAGGVRGGGGGAPHRDDVGGDDGPSRRSGGDACGGAVGFVPGVGFAVPAAAVLGAVLGLSRHRPRAEPPPSSG
ncbi:hypothetical protein KCH_28250 [Kitasatospora cheerisanensis KCTC 2395]|uniref:Uncharacterized protein n=1 Tax=Kitasatospora cheerisanensis KCTC 2395 TaxID=1348663 RepID=A0A066YZK9_9ACTN|nr:hypothetical protein KCH_28250 [Kitasatospora cheerisanensis KCTC 2395]